MSHKQIIIVGLGNPGTQYARTRHNVGWMVLDQLKSQLALPDFAVNKKFHAEVSSSKDITLLKPLTFMNDSGVAVESLLSFYQFDLSSCVVIVIHDDLDIELGKYKLMFGKGPKIHNGLLSIYQHLKTDQFWHLRIGVDARQGDRTVPGHVYVLQTFSSHEQQKIEAVIIQCCQEIQSTFRDD